MKSCITGAADTLLTACTGNARMFDFKNVDVIKILNLNLSTKTGSPKTGVKMQFCWCSHLLKLNTYQWNPNEMTHHPEDSWSAWHESIHNNTNWVHKVFLKANAVALSRIISTAQGKGVLWDASCFTYLVISMIQCLLNAVKLWMFRNFQKPSIAASSRA